MQTNTDAYLIAIQGRLVPCDSVEEALQLMRAKEILASGEPRPPGELRKLAAVLAKYHYPADAEELARHAARMAVAQLFETHLTFRRRN